jgi:hypothetical protein
MMYQERFQYLEIIILQSEKNMVGQGFSVAACPVWARGIVRSGDRLTVEHRY